MPAEGVESLLMSTLRTIFEVNESINCPLYSRGDQLSLTARCCSARDGKEMCLVLARDFMNILVMMQGKLGGDQPRDGKPFNCSGCIGLIKFSERFRNNEADSKVEKTVSRLLQVMKELNGRAVDCPFLEALRADRIDDILDNFEPVPVPAGTVLIKQNRPSLKLYLILSGRFVLERNKEIVTILNAGEIVGEMSCLGAVRTLWTVQALEDGLVVDVTAQEFGHLLSSSATVLIYIAKLLAIRLELLNAVKLIDTSASMSGSLEDITPAELCQVFHLHQKSGVLKLNFRDGDASVAFRNGGIVNASHKNLSGKNALFTILGKSSGSYRFVPGLSSQDQKAAEIGQFMMLLMEGVQKDDERADIKT
jgi:CRP-like cAMP-binding protein